MTARQKDRAKEKREIEVGGSRKGVAGVEAATQGRTRAMHKREGSAVGTGTASSATCAY